MCLVQILWIVTLRTSMTTHGHCRRYAYTSTYRSWKSMQQRCFNPHCPRFENYGGRGIGICDRWRLFSLFWEDMGDRPEGMTLDRIDNDGNYEPENCRWATPKQQRANSRPLPCTVMLTCYSGEKGTKSIPEWSRISGTNLRTIWSRRRKGWTDKECVFGRAA